MKILHVVSQGPALGFPTYWLKGRTPGWILTIYGLNDVSSPKDVPFGKMWMTILNFKGLKPKKKQAKRGVVTHFPAKLAKLRIFHPNWQNYKITITPAGKTGSTPSFDKVIEPHS